MKESKFRELYFSQDANLLRSVIKYRDEETFRHCKMTAKIAREIGLECGFYGKQLEVLYLSALFHDIGNTGIPDSILLKPENLSKSEYASVKYHSEIGEQILQFAEFEGSEDISKIIRHHHEYFNGTGYPDRLVAEEIPVYSRIIGIADSYTAMAENRIASRRKTHQEIMGIMNEESGVKHDPYFMNIFKKTFADKKDKEPG